MKQNNKNKLAEYLKEATGVDVNPCSLFDIQVKRLEKFKASEVLLMFLFYCIKFA